MESFQVSSFYSYKSHQPPGLIPVCVCGCVFVSAAIAWSLHRDLGFPLDLVDLMLEERGVRVDHQELDTLITQNKVFSSWHPGAFWGVLCISLYVCEQMSYSVTL